MINQPARSWSYLLVSKAVFAACVNIFRSDVWIIIIVGYRFEILKYARYKISQRLLYVRRVRILVLELYFYYVHRWLGRLGYTRVSKLRPAGRIRPANKF